MTFPKTARHLAAALLAGTTLTWVGAIGPQVGFAPAALAQGAQIDPVPEEDLGPVDVAHSGEHSLVHQ